MTSNKRARESDVNIDKKAKKTRFNDNESKLKKLLQKEKWSVEQEGILKQSINELAKQKQYNLINTDLLVNLIERIYKSDIAGRQIMLSAIFNSKAFNSIDQGILLSYLSSGTYVKSEKILTVKAAFDSCHLINKFQKNFLSHDSLALSAIARNINIDYQNLKAIFPALKESLYQDIRYEELFLKCCEYARKEIVKSFIEDKENEIDEKKALEVFEDKFILLPISK